MAERFPDPVVASNVQFDLKRITFYDDLLNQIELEIVRHAKLHDANTFHLLDTIPGVGKILALVMLLRRSPKTSQYGLIRVSHIKNRISKRSHRES